MIAQIATSCVWFVKGMLEYTQRGYEKAAQTFPQTRGLMTNRSQRLVALVTGANSGIGYETSFCLAEKGVSVYMICRNEERAKEAKAELITRLAGKGRQDDRQLLYVRIVDVSRPLELKSLAEEWKRENRPLHILVNNAGVLLTDMERTLTPEGFEKTFATNSLSTYLLTEWMRPVMEQTARQELSLFPNEPFIPRVISVSSGGMYTQKLDIGPDFNFTNLKPFDGTQAYAQTKRQQVEMTRFWGGLKNDSKILYFSMHPGWCDTPGVQTSLPIFHARLKDNLRSLSQGADTVIWAALDSPVKSDNGDSGATGGGVTDIPNGSFLQDRKAVATSLFLGGWTESRDDEISEFMSNMQKIKEKFE